MDALAARAGVGKGTVFRRFGSREGLMASLLDHREAEWQAGVISGPPPLGPGAAPLARLHAFGASRMRLHLDQAALIEAAGRTWGRTTRCSASRACTCGCCSASSASPATSATSRPRSSRRSPCPCCASSCTPG
nr:helix-turn-helix domain-containing protein [Nocardioides convexus]